MSRNNLSRVVKWLKNLFDETFRSHYYWHRSHEGLQRRIKAIKEWTGIGEDEVREWNALTNPDSMTSDDFIDLAEELLPLGDIWGEEAD